MKIIAAFPHNLRNTRSIDYEKLNQVRSIFIERYASFIPSNVRLWNHFTLTDVYDQKWIISYLGKITNEHKAYLHYAIHRSYLEFYWNTYGDQYFSQQKSNEYKKIVTHLVNHINPIKLEEFVICDKKTKSDVIYTIIKAIWIKRIKKKYLTLLSFNPLSYLTLKEWRDLKIYIKSLYIKYQKHPTLLHNR